MHRVISAVQQSCDCIKKHQKSSSTSLLTSIVFLSPFHFLSPQVDSFFSYFSESTLPIICFGLQSLSLCPLIWWPFVCFYSTVWLHSRQFLWHCNRICLLRLDYCFLFLAIFFSNFHFTRLPFSVLFLVLNCSQCHCFCLSLRWGWQFWQLWSVSFWTADSIAAKMQETQEGRKTLSLVIAC